MSRLTPGGVDNNNQRLIRVGDPSAPTDAANKQYVDNALAGLAWKQPARVASTANVTLATGVAAGQSIDGITLTTGMRVLLKNQTAPAENGLWIAPASGAPTRATDADSTTELNNATFYVIDGSVNHDSAYTQTVNDPTVGTTGLVFAQVGGGTTYTAGNGLTLSGSSFAVVPKSGGGLIVDGTGVSIDRTVSGSKVGYATDLAAGATTTTVTHGLGTRDVVVKTYDKTTDPWVEVDMDVQIPTGGNTITILTPVAVVSGQYRIVILPL